jgi:hypothetical protein
MNLDDKRAFRAEFPAHILAKISIVNEDVDSLQNGAKADVLNTPCLCEEG